MHDASNNVKAQEPCGGPPRRVAVIGRAGAGKTTVALWIGEALGVPVVHLDRLAWAPGWRLGEAPELAKREAEVVAGEAWVIDGGYLSSTAWPERSRRADVVVLVEAPLVACLWRIVRRSLVPGRRRRPDLPDGCGERLSLAFLYWTLTWRRRTRAAIRALEAEKGDRVVRVRCAGDTVAEPSDDVHPQTKTTVPLIQSAREPRLDDGAATGRQPSRRHGAPAGPDGRTRDAHRRNAPSGHVRRPGRPAARCAGPRATRAGRGGTAGSPGRDRAPAPPFLDVHERR